MSDRDEKLNKGELIDIKSLIGDADGGDFSLDDIMAEYGYPPEPPEELPATPEDLPGNMVPFPGRRAVPPPEEPDEEAPPLPEEPPQTAEITPFPKKRSGLSALVQDLNRKADDYADRMFEEDEAIDKAEVRRLERLIPGTDREADEEDRVRRWRPPPGRRSAWHSPGQWWR